jgi:hypothetical protein
MDKRLILVLLLNHLSTGQKEHYYRHFVLKRQAHANVKASQGG